MSSDNNSSDKNNPLDNDNGAFKSASDQHGSDSADNFGQASNDTHKTMTTLQQSYSHDEKYSTQTGDQGVSGAGGAQLLERNVKQIQIKEVSTVEKVIKTREVRHVSPTGEQTTVSYPDDENTAYNLVNHEPSKPAAQQTISVSNNSKNAVYSTDVTPTSNRPNNSNGASVARFDEAMQQEQSQCAQYFPSDANYGSTITSTSANAYQNYPTSANTNMPQQNETSQQQQQQQATNAPMPPMRRSSSKVHQVPPSGYDELDSTLGYTTSQSGIPYEHQQQQANMMQQSPYGYINKQTGQMMMPIQSVNNQIPVNHQQDGGIDPYDPYGRTIANDLGFLDQRSTYDTAYGGGTAGPSTVGPVSASQGIYGQATEPMYVSRAMMPGPTMHVQHVPMVEQVVQSNGQPMDVRWRDPDLNEVIQFLNNSNPVVRANAAAYLQHLSYMDDGIKQQTRFLGGIPILINLLECDVPDVQRNACGALRNLSFGRQNDDNKLAIREAGGVQSLVKSLVNTLDNEMRELVTGVLWNLSSCEDIKRSIIDDALSAIVNIIILPHTAWVKSNIDARQNIIPNANEAYWSTVFRNASGILRNISSAGAYARKQLRECEGLVESLLTIIKVAISKNDVENKLVENCVCILRNLSYRCQEVQDPEYDKNAYTNSSANNSTQSSPASPSSSSNLASSFVGQLSLKMGDNLGCFGIGRKSKSKSNGNNASRSLTEQGSASSSTTSTLPLNETLNRINSNDHPDQQKNILMPPHHHMNQTNSKFLDKSATFVRTSTQLGQLNNTSATLPRQVTSSTINNTSFISGPNSGLISQGKELLWQPDVVKPYLSLLSECSNSETLEAAAGAIQNLTACYWQPSIDIRATVRKEKGLPVLVELLRMDRDRVVCAVATALRNLAIDQRNKELIGKYAMHDLISKLPNGDANHDSAASDETVAAVLATLNEVISKNSDFARSLFEAGGIERLNYIIKNRTKFSVRVQRFTAQVLLNMWNFVELREIFKKAGWKENNFLVRSHILNKNSTYSIYSTNTIDRPMSSQQSDKKGTAKRAVSSGALDTIDGRSNHMVSQIQMQNSASPYGTMHMIPVSHVSDQQMAPLYAQIIRDKKRNQQTMSNVAVMNGLGGMSSMTSESHIDHSQLDPNVYSMSSMPQQQQMVAQPRYVNKQMPY